MTLTITDLLAKKCSLSTVILGIPVHLEYRPHVITPEVMAKLGNLKLVDSLVSQICLLVASWDIEIEQGKPLPITEKDLAKIPTDFLSGILKAINDDNKPDEETKNA